jgi:electron transport complex protein RnfC
MNPFKLWTFHGGLHLAGHKEESTRLPLRAARLPERLVFPLQQRSGRNAEPCVAPGDRVLKGQIIAGGGDPLNPPIHASTSGVVRTIEARPLPHPSGLSDLCIVIEADGEDAAAELEGTTDYREHPPEELRRRIHQAGIVGLGGAGFPTAVKIASSSRRVDTLILNGAECEPYITCDESLLRGYADEVLRGAEILRHILRAEQGLVAIENDMPEAVAAAERARLEGGFEHLHIVRVPAVYPTGGEKQLIRVLTGREVPSRGIPADAGVVCHNVGTAAAVYRAVVRGEPLISRIVTVTGRGVGEPQNLEVRLGTSIADLVEQCGGYTGEAERLILGGPMMGFALPTDDLPIVKSANCILVAARGELTGQKQPQPCIRCGACADACPANLLPQQLYWYSRSDQLERTLEYRLFDCIECGCCDVVCPSHIPLVQYFRAAKGKAIAKQRERDKADHARLRFEAREARKEREKRERAEAARRKKENLEKAAAPEIRQAIERARQKRAEKHPAAEISGHSPASAETEKPAGQAPFAATENDNAPVAPAGVKSHPD